MHYNEDVNLTGGENVMPDQMGDVEGVLFGSPSDER